MENEIEVLQDSQLESEELNDNSETVETETTEAEEIFDEEQSCKCEIFDCTQNNKFYKNKKFQIIAAAGVAALAVGGVVLGTVISKKKKSSENVIDKVKQIKLPRIKIIK